MRQQAIYFTRFNASRITDALIDYTDPADLLAEYSYMFDGYPSDYKLVLVKVMPLGTTQSVLSHVVRESMFHANATTTEPLTDEYFVEVIQL